MTTVIAGNAGNGNQEKPDLEGMSPEALSYYLDGVDGPTRENVLRIIKEKVEKTIQDNSITSTPWTDNHKAKILMQNVVTTDDFYFVINEIRLMGLNQDDYEQYLPPKEEIKNPIRVFLSKGLLKLSLLYPNFMMAQFLKIFGCYFISSNAAYYSIWQELAEEMKDNEVAKKLFVELPKECYLSGAVPPTTKAKIFVHPTGIIDVVSFAGTVAAAKVLKANYLLHLNNEWPIEEIKVVEVGDIGVMTPEKFIQKMVPDINLVIGGEDEPIAQND